MALDIKPTRSELLNLKDKIKLGKNGHSLLKKKRDGLVMEFFEIMKQAKTLRQEMVDAYKEAKKKLNIVRVTESELYLKSLALATTRKPKIRSEAKNVMGIKIPKIESTEEIRKDFADRGYGIVSGSSMIDDVAHAFEEVIEKAIKVSEIENSMKKILAEIEKTKRRVNALEFSVIPEMEDAQKFIGLRLEELERDNLSGMKHIKRKKAK